ncbi:MAG: RelA/SpoT family protein [Candidatus Hydrogenedentes bacterium]|nr:RelA/SpoT family protein [Candidatus Hydrogenedentota bacterium]
MIQGYSLSQSSLVTSRFYALKDLLSACEWGASAIERVESAFRFASNAHLGQKRYSGEPYIIHPIEVAILLAEIKLDPDTVIAGLLHDTLEDTEVTFDEIKEKFGEQVGKLVDGVTKVSDQQKQFGDVNGDIHKLEAVRKPLLESVSDPRIIIIKLADRLHNLRTVKSLPIQSQIKNARETLSIYSPIAHQLGLYRWKMELDDLSFEILYPKEFECLSKRIAKSYQEREAEISQIMEEVRKKLKSIGIDARVLGRPKHIYSIYRKMVRDNITLERVMDLYGIRIIVKTEEECYRVLDVAHQLGTVMEKRFRDNIKVPRDNGYRSLHTTVLIPDKYPLEIQIRTEEMDYEAEYGVAAHWRYKDGKMTYSPEFFKRIERFRQIISQHLGDEKEVETYEDLESDLQPKEIRVFTPKHDFIDLPYGSTVLDFAYAIHTELGHHCVGGYVGGKLVSIDTPLFPNTIVEIKTSTKQEPQIEWLRIAKTGRARNKIRHYLREKGVLPKLEEKNKDESKEVREKQPESDQKQIKFPEFENSLASLESSSEILQKELQTAVKIDGEKNISIRFARCCSPTPGDEIVAYATIRGNITVHRKDCKTLNNQNMDPVRIHRAKWESKLVNLIFVVIEAKVNDRLFQDIYNYISLNKLLIKTIQIENVKNLLYRIEIVFPIITPNHSKLVEQFIRSAKSMPGVIKVRKKSVEN